MYNANEYDDDYKDDDYKDDETDDFSINEFNLDIMLNNDDSSNKTNTEIDYDDILMKMNMRMFNGKLQVIKKGGIMPSYFNQLDKEENEYENRGEYENEDEKRRRTFENMSPLERKKAMYMAYIEQQKQRMRIRQVKSKKLAFSNQYINISPFQREREREMRFPSRGIARERSGLDKIFKLKGLK